MADDEKKELDPLVTMPHGREQLIKMEIVGMIHGGESPYDVISHVARWLEKESGEAGYAQYVDEQIRSVYGFALQHVKPMEDELRDVKARLVRILPKPGFFRGGTHPHRLCRGQAQEEHQAAGRNDHQGQS